MKYLILVLLLVGCRGPEGIRGVNGATGPTGLVGQTGTDGATGAQGQQGLAGADGTAINMVKLCPDTPSYGTFVEFGLCINGQLYGVYSANGGFLSLLPNGNYSSTGIGSSCNLTVSGCTVTH